MTKSLLRVTERTDKLKKTRNEGFVPGIIYGRDLDESMPIKFEELELQKVLRAQGLSPIMPIMMDGEKRQVLIKEVQRNPVRGNIIHVDLQAIAADEEIRTTIPVIFTGREEIERQGLLLEVYLLEIEVAGPADAIVDSIAIDISEKGEGDTVNMQDIELDPRISAITPADEVLAVITMPRMEVEEDEAEDEVDMEVPEIDGEESEESGE